MRIARISALALLLALPLVAAESVQAQQRAAPAPRITLEEAQTAMDAAVAEARANGWNLAFVITDADGVPIYVRRMDGVPTRNYEIAMNKVGTVITAEMHTVDYAAAVEAGAREPIEGALTYEGGLLLRRNGEIVGAFSASGARGSEDAQAVLAGMAAIGISP